MLGSVFSRGAKEKGGRKEKGDRVPGVDFHSGHMSGNGFWVVVFVVDLDTPQGFRGRYRVVRVVAPFGKFTLFSIVFSFSGGGRGVATVSPVSL